MPSVLVVEDNPLVAKFYRLALQRAGGYDVVLTEDVEEILRLAANHAVDAVILDVSLRNCRREGRPVDGIELAQLIRSRSGEVRIPILLATAHAMEGDRQRLLAASGADDYLEKPIYDPQVLIRKVEQLMAK
jgi:two-component system cell cycle response regulator DivK